MADGKKARELGVLVAAFFAVLGLAGFLFKYHESRRAAELDAQLAQDAARLGREIELRYKNYRAMVDNVTRLKTSGGAPRASATAEAAGAKTPSVAEYVNSLVVLPSQKDELQKCEQQPSLGEAQLCVAEQMRRLNDATGVEMVACAATSSTPSLSADGRYLVIPPSDSATTLPVCGRVKVRSLLASADSASTGAERSETTDEPFDTVLLLRRDGTTLRSIDFGSNLRLAALPGFDPKRAVASAVLQNLEIGTGKYRAFLQPVRLRLSPEGAAAAAPEERREHSDLVVCGLVREDALAKASVQLSLPSYLWVVLLFGAGLLSLPLAKLWTIGPKATFRLADVTALTMSALLLTLLCTLVILGFLAHNRLARRADDQLQRVGLELEHRLRDRIKASARQLNGFMTDSATKPLLGLVEASPPKTGDHTPDQRCTRAGGKSVERVPFAEDAGGRSVCEQTQFEPARVERGGWSLFFVLDRDGYERVKFVSSDRDSAAVSVKERHYFQRARDNHTACLDTSNCSVRGVPELVRSITSGKMILVVAAPICSGNDGCAGEPPKGVAAFQEPLDDLQDLTLPLGVQAAVIGSNGQIMLHSNNDAHHEQNLFAEVDAPEELRAAITAGVPDTITLNYLGQPSRIHFEPMHLPGTGWSVLTITPRAIVDVATTDMVIVSLVGYGLLLAITLFGACAVLMGGKLSRFGSGRLDRQAHGHDHEFSLRPSAAHSREYANLGLYSLRAGAILSLLALAAPRFFPTSVGLIGALVVCGYAGWKVWQLSHQPRRSMPPSTPEESRAEAPNKGRWQEFLPLTYLLCCAGLAEIFVMAPAAILFAGAYDHVVDVLVRAEQRHFSDALGDREECLKAVPADVTTPACQGVLGSGDEQTRSAFASAWQGHSGVIPSPIPYLVADLLPPVGTREAATAGRLYRVETAAPPTPPAHRFESVRARASIVLQRTLPDRDTPPRVFETALPALIAFPLNATSFVVLVLVAAAVLGASYVVGFHSLQRLFFLNLLLDLRRPSPLELAPRLTGHAGSATRHWLLVNAASTARARLLKAGSFQELPFELPAPGSSDDAAVDGWLVSDFDAWVAKDPDATTLARALTLRAPVVILAPRDPLEDLPAEHGEAWAYALERFVRFELGPQEAAHAAPSKATLVRWWYECDANERRLLAQLALGHYVTPHQDNQPALKALAVRGLLDPDTLNLAHEDLKIIALRGVTRSEQEKWSSEDRDSNWTALRVPLTTGVASLLAAVALAKPELGLASAVVPTLAASLPVALRLLTQMLNPAQNTSSSAGQVPG